jgi:hypothetical protein
MAPFVFLGSCSNKIDYNCSQQSNTEKLFMNKM